MKNTIYIISAIFGIIILALILFLVYPLLGDIKNGSAQILLERGQVTNKELENQELARFKEKYKEYQPNLSKIDTLFTDSKDPIEFIRFLETIAASAATSTDVKLVSSQGEALGNWPTSIFEINAKGDFSHILRFSQMLETGPYLVKIQKISMKKEEVQTGGKEIVGPKRIEADMLVQVITQ
jgi:hypothetical protein